MTTLEIEKRPWQELLEWPSSLLGERSSWGTCNLVEDENKVTLLVDLPGARREDVSLRHHNGHLHIRAARSAEWGAGSEEKRWMRKNISLPEVDPKTLSARLENGVLEISAERGEPTEEIEIS